VTALEHLRNLLEAESALSNAIDRPEEELRCAYDAALCSARAYLASPATVNPAVKRWQEAADVNQFLLVEWVQNAPEQYQPEAKRAADLLEALAASGGDEEHTA
jgi:hypothetical protein